MTPVTSPGRRARTTAAIGCLAGAALLLASGLLPWWTRRYDDPLSGPLTVSANGSALWAALIPLALVVVAGYGAASLSMPIIRRVVGIVIVVAGLAAVVAAVALLADAPLALLDDRLRRPAAASAAANISWGGPIAALSGGVFGAVGGAAVVAGWPRRARSVAYDSPLARRDRTGGVEDPDATDLWRALDAGADPTDADGAGPERPPRSGDSW